MNLKLKLLIASIFVCSGLIAQSDSTKVIPLGEKTDTIVFKGLLAENPLSIQVYRQITKSQYFSVNGEIKQKVIDVYYEVKRSEGFVRIRVVPEQYIWVGKL